MQKIWVINQHANTPNMPGHTRQFEIAKGLVKKGWNVYVFASDFNLSTRKFIYNKNKISSLQLINGINWHWLKVIPYYSNNWKRYLNIISFSTHLLIKLIYKSILDKLFDKLPDLIFASSPQLPSAFVGLIISKIINRPFILEIRDLWPQVLIEQGGMDQSSFIIKILSILEKLLYQNADHVIVLAKGSVDFVKKRGAKHVTWLPNGPDLEIFKKQSLPKEPEKFTFIEPFKIFYTGAHGEANALDIVIDAARLIRDLPIKIYLVGDGPEKKKLIKYSKGLENIIFKDPIPKNEIPKLLKNSHSILLTLKNIKLYSYGVSPNKLYDAYAIGRPVITNVNGDINDEVNINRIGITSNPNSYKSLASAIRQMFYTPRLKRIKMANRARLLAESLYSREKIVNKLNKILLENLTNS